MRRWESKLSDEEIMRRFNIFMKRYGDKYDDYIREILYTEFLKNVGEREMYGEFYQLYDHLNIIQPKDNPYIYHLNTISNNFDLSGNILEVGCGAYPSFARRIADKQLKIGKGTITVYDPSLVTRRTTKYKNMKLVAKEFTPEVSIKEYDLVIGIMPCLATDSIIESLSITPKDFYISFCGCDHYAIRFGYNPFRFMTPSYNSNIEELKHICEKKDLGQLILDELPPYYCIDYPVVYNKRKTK